MPLTVWVYLHSNFYRAMHYSAKRGIEIACRLSVCNVSRSGRQKLEIL